ncbi:hypothetical protein SSS_02031 [Sarcoptes scabiei]|uniref:Uncharacterized protein n=1 Tax=Sarcoptes scabiei TaxID=52283 RepID=A0A834REH0_SARSC|nr:hypothetical protein SSS_02031 [Sarcoptes scabiei]
MSSGFSNSQLDAESMHSHHFVEFFFPFIDLVIERLVFLRRNVSGPIPNDDLGYFIKIENQLGSLKRFMIIAENSVRHRVSGPLVSSAERIRILDEFYVAIIVSHLQCVDLCRTIRLNGPNITLEMAFEGYRRAAYYLVRFGYLFLIHIAQN